jgi:hypothetical protein
MSGQGSTIRSVPGSASGSEPPARKPRKFSDQARANMSAARRGLKHSPEHRAAIVAGAKPENMKRASSAASETISRKLDDLGAVKLADALEARGINYAVGYNWATCGRSGSLRPPVFRGPRRMLCVREDELDAELEKWRCTWEDADGRCERYALLSQTGVCHEHRLAIPRAGMMTATEFAEKHDIFPAHLTARLAAREIPGKPMDRGASPAGWLVDEHAALEMFRGRFICAGDGCERFALGPSGYCGACRPFASVGQLHLFHGESTAAMRDQGSFSERWPWS